MPFLLAVLTLSLATGRAYGAQLETVATGTLSIPAATCDGQQVAAIAEIAGGGVAQSKRLQAPVSLALVPGKWTIRLRSGPHCRRVERDIEVRAGETLEFGPVNLARVVDLRKLGWYAGTLGFDSIAGAEGLDWTAPLTPAPASSAIAGRSYSARDGQIGALGPPIEFPAGLEGLPSYATLAAWHNLGAATFASNLHAELPLDLAAARLVDGLILTGGGESSLALWSILLDHGYALAPVAGPHARLYVQCTGGLSPGCLADAVRQRRTVVSTGPILLATAAGAGRIDVEAWARQDQPDRLLRVELWAHNRVIATLPATAGESQHVAAPLTWIPKGAGDWVAVRVVSESGWALSSAFFFEPQPAPAPLLSHVKMVFPEIASYGGMVATVWPVSPAIPGAQRLQTVEVDGNALEIDAPATALVRVELSDGRRIDTRLPEANGVRTLLEDLAASDRRAEALLDWSIYEEVLRRCRRVVIESRP